MFASLSVVLAKLVALVLVGVNVSEPLDQEDIRDVKEIKE
jgi:hypothetical protein